MTVGLDERFAAARAVADAVLYEGYILYPYRASSAKNQCRWQFGVIAPRAFSEAAGSDPWRLQTECVVEGGRLAEICVRVRALHVQTRTAVPADRLPAWDEAVERQLDLGGLAVGDLLDTPRVAAFCLPGGIDVEDAGRLARSRVAVDGRVCVSAEEVPGPYRLVRVRIEVENHTAWSGPALTRDDVARHSLVAVHTLIAVDGGRFYSLIDPPEFASGAVRACRNEGTFPVLIDDDVMLSSPIILYDRPEIAPESPGDFCDATEIDELLALRVLTLTGEELAEARATDPRAAAILDRCEAMSDDAREQLHGTVRMLRRVPPITEPGSDRDANPFEDTIRCRGEQIGRGAHVRLYPGRRADAQDVFLVGRTGTVQGVFSDLDGEVCVAVTVDDDPGADLHAWYGRYLYFHPDEVEPA